MNRGRNREKIFIADKDAKAFLLAIHNTIERYGIEVHAFSLMPNHYHLLVRTPHDNLYKKDGTLFRGRHLSLTDFGQDAKKAVLRIRLIDAGCSKRWRGVAVQFSCRGGYQTAAN